MKVLLKRIWKYLLFLLIVAGCAYMLQPGFAKYIEHRDEVKRLEARITELEIERLRLQSEIRALQEEDPEYIERLAREKLHLVKPGETIFRFKPKK